jgi:sugar phosphate isomerase/epimerase
LGLPLWDATPAARDTLLDEVFGELGFAVLELHLESGCDGSHARIISPATLQRVADIAASVAARRGTLVLGLGARDLMGPEPHEPSLTHPDPSARAQRRRLVEEAIDLAASTGAEALVLLSGRAHEGAPGLKHASPAWLRFEAELERLLRRAEARQVLLAPEAHSRHVFANLLDLHRLRERLPSACLGFTADAAHQTVTEPRPLRELYRELGNAATIVQLDNLACKPSSERDPLRKIALDARGAVDLPGVIAGLIAARYRGVASVEFLRRDHPDVDPLEYCRRSAAWLKRVCRSSVLSGVNAERIHT